MNRPLLPLLRREIDRLIADSDACLRRTEMQIGCPIGEFVPAIWIARRRSDRREIDRRNSARENSDRRAR